MACTPRSPWLRLLFVYTVSFLLPSISAQGIECISPHKMGDGERPVYHTGETRQFQWKSSFPRFNLTIVQVNSENQAKTYDKIYENEPNTTANFFWTAENMDGLSQDDPMHLWIVNAENKDCNACNCRSTNFTVLDATMKGNSSSTPAPAPSASSTSSNSSSEHLRLGLGLGLGLGVPLLITLTALATWLCVRRRRQQRQQQTPLPTASTYTSSMHPQDPAAVPLYSARTYTQPSSTGYTSEASEKSPAPEMDGREVAEMQTDGVMRVEAPQSAVRAELEGSDISTGGRPEDMKKF